MQASTKHGKWAPDCRGTNLLLRLSGAAPAAEAPRAPAPREAAPRPHKAGAVNTQPRRLPISLVPPRRRSWH